MAVDLNRMYHESNLETMSRMEDNSVDSIVTDPPYGLRFMGKKWDYDVPPVEVWKECLRVLKPGGYLLAFAGTRTQHRMAVRIEDAGFEIRDMIAWVYGSGFPKSLDVSKAIDKIDASEIKRGKQLIFTEWMRTNCPLTPKQANDIMGTSAEAGHYFTSGEQPHIATRDHFEKLRPYFKADVPVFIEEMVTERTVESENFKQRKVIGQTTGSNHANGSKSCFSVGAEMVKVEIPITAPASPEAIQWQGWGTALKPALEPITVARKPIEGTVAANVLKWGTGGINIDGCRVGDSGARNNGSKPAEDGYQKNEIFGKRMPAERVDYEMGRFPSNLIHDGSEEVLSLFPETSSGASNPKYIQKESSNTCMSGKNYERPMQLRDKDTGSAARFFYTAKASQSERGKGNDHPTVKPLAIMRYLCRLVTPPGGIIYDPYAGSGTTIIAAIEEGFSAFGSDLDAHHCDIFNMRIRHGIQPKMF